MKEPLKFKFIDNPYFIHDFLEIKYSNIEKAGLGIFTKTPLKKGKFLGNYVGKIDTQNPENSYTFDSNRNNKLIFIDASDLNYSNWTRYMNCSSNKKNDNIMVIRCENKEIYFLNNKTYYLEGYMMFYTKRDIKEGEELLFDYGSEFKKLLGLIN